MADHPYIAIEGAIGVGKTTLARILGEALPAEVLLEVFEENPFLSDFYADRARYAFQTQLFFLLSRYRQQYKIIAETLRRGRLVSDYLFAKDWLFAHLNLAGDELAMYERVHAILGEQIPRPDLVIHLEASTDTLMQRIAFRDRVYERGMDRDYIDALRLAYERFLGEYAEAPILVLDTDSLDFVRSLDHRAEVVSRVKQALQAATFQPHLPELEAPPSATPDLEQSRRLPDLQRFQKLLDREDEGSSDPFLAYISLTERLGALGEVLTQAWIKREQLLPQVGNRREAQDRALEVLQPHLQDQLSGVLACLLRIANNAGADLESSYLRKMRQK